jgi:hypothetical protein
MEAESPELTANLLESGGKISETAGEPSETLEKVMGYPT